VDADSLSMVMDKLTTLPGGNKGQQFGLVNVNTASEEVLRLLPKMDANLARTIVQGREGWTPEEDDDCMAVWRKPCLRGQV